MKKSRLERLIAQFNKKELKNLQKFVASPYFNSQQGLSELLNYCISNPTPVFDKEAAYKAIFPTKKFNESDFRLHKSYLYRLIEKYIAYEEIEKKIASLLEEYVKPAVEQDGGNIKFLNYHEGIVKVLLQGACSGCPSSTMTLKSGIQNLLNQMLPGQIQSVEAVNG